MITNGAHVKFVRSTKVHKFEPARTKVLYSSRSEPAGTKVPYSSKRAQIHQSKTLRQAKDPCTKSVLGAMEIIFVQTKEIVITCILCPTKETITVTIVCKNVCCRTEI